MLLLTKPSEAMLIWAEIFYRILYKGPDPANKSIEQDQRLDAEKILTVATSFESSVFFSGERFRKFVFVGFGGWGRKIGNQFYLTLPPKLSSLTSSDVRFMDGSEKSQVTFWVADSVTR